MPKAVFAGCARDCAPFLDGVLRNIETFASIYDSFEVIIVENDSADDTRLRLQEFAASRGNVRLIEADGLEERHPKRGDRLAVARNLYMDAVREDYYSDCDDLVVIDFDDVNCEPIDGAAFEAARRWLWQEPNRRGVFANSAPFYYDLWPLRHPTWCPDDCWERVRKTQRALGLDEAVRRFVASRQIPIAPDTPPIMVDSAFGGLGIYRREATLGATYIGLDPDDEEVCDHASFNASVKGADGVLAIFPSLQNQSPIEHIMGALRRAKDFNLEQDGAKCTLTGPPDHQLQMFRAVHPLYDRRLPALARIVSDRAPDECFIDIGANIGDTIALARLAGARMPAVAIESSVTYSKYLWANVKESPALFGKIQLGCGSAGAAGDSGAVALGAGNARLGSAESGNVERRPGVDFGALVGSREVSLFKMAREGFDQEIIAAELRFLIDKKPILWMKTQTMSADDEVKWRALFRSLAADWPKAILFDNFGFGIAAGDSSALLDHAVDLMAYARRQRGRAGYQPTLYYLEIALFPSRFEQVYDEFRGSLAEMDE